jgi:16S rRNA U1498 N3-methylase RsmE
MDVGILTMTTELRIIALITGTSIQSTDEERLSARADFKRIVSQAVNQANRCKS